MHVYNVKKITTTHMYLLARQEEIMRTLTIGWDAIGLARLGVASISCGLLHSCGVLRLPIRSHILG